MRKTFVLLAVLCLGLTALPAAAATAPSELTFELFLTESTACHQQPVAQTPAAAGEQRLEPFDLDLAAGGGSVGGEQCGSVVCRKGTECCNASCSWCVPEGMSCIQIAC